MMRSRQFLASNGRYDGSRLKERGRDLGNETSGPQVDALVRAHRSTDSEEQEISSNNLGQIFTSSFVALCALMTGSAIASPVH